MSLPELSPYWDTNNLSDNIKAAMRALSGATAVEDLREHRRRMLQRARLVNNAWRCVGFSLLFFCLAVASSSLLFSWPGCRFFDALAVLGIVAVGLTVAFFGLVAPEWLQDLLEPTMPEKLRPIYLAWKERRLDIDWRAGW